MQGGKPSKLSKELGNIRAQLKSGKTRSQNPRHLTPSEIKALEEQRDALQKQMQEAAKQHTINRINSHTTSAINAAADRIVESVSVSIQSATASSSQFFESVGGVGSSQDLRAQAAVLRVRAAEKAKEENKAAKEAEKAAKRSASTTASQARKRLRITCPRDAYEKNSMAELRQLLAQKHLETKGRTKCELIDRLLAYHGPKTGPWHLNMPALHPQLIDPIYAKFSRKQTQRSKISRGSVVTLCDSGSECVPNEFRDVAVTLTAVNSARNDVEFVANGKIQHWFLDSVGLVESKVHDVDPGLQRWIKSCKASSGTGEIKCGRPTNADGFCNGPSPCPCHKPEKHERSSMEIEDHRSRQCENGICGIPFRNGGICVEPKGRCKFHPYVNSIIGWFVL